MLFFQESVIGNGFIFQYHNDPNANAVNIWREKLLIKH